MYPFTKYLKFLIKDVKIVWARSMKGISSPPPGTVDRDRRNTPHARTAMSIFSLRLAAIDCLGAIWWRLVTVYLTGHKRSPPLNCTVSAQLI